MYGGLPRPSPLLPLRDDGTYRPDPLVSLLWVKRGGQNIYSCDSEFLPVMDGTQTTT